MTNILDFDYYFYDYSNRTQALENIIANIPTWLSFVRIVLVILLRAGYVLIHIGSVPVNNINLILLQNIIDICWITMIYSLLGIIIAYTGDVHGVIGAGHWIGDHDVDKDELITGWSAVVITAAICTSGIVGRTHTVGYIIIGFLLAGIVQPFLIHWIWTPHGWMRRNVLNKQHVHFHDYTGSVVIHVLGGLTGLIGCLTLGRRILRLDAIDEASIAVGASGNVFAGYLLVFVGLQSLSLTNIQLEHFEMKIKRKHNVFVNNILAASACSLFVVIFHFAYPQEEFNHWTVMRCVQAMIAGVVVISAGADAYSPLAAIILGAVGSIIFYIISRYIFRSALEDYCNIVATHLVCGILGTVLVPFFYVQEDDDVKLVLLNFGWQMICLIVVIVLVSIIMYIAFIILQFAGLLRNRSEYLNHLRANVAEGRNQRKNLLDRLFRMDRDAVYLQPGMSFGEPLGLRRTQEREE